MTLEMELAGFGKLAVDGTKDRANASKRLLAAPEGRRPSRDERLMNDYRSRGYLSVVEAATHTGLSVPQIHGLIKTGRLPAHKSASGQYRFDLRHLSAWQRHGPSRNMRPQQEAISVCDTTQQVIVGDARNLATIANESIHLAVTSPPYFNAKMYSASTDGDLGNVHDLDEWLSEIGQVWKEVYRTLQPGRKFFLNIMNLPIRQNKTFRSLNLVGKNIDLCESIGFAFKRDIIWHKTNGVRAHFGTYPYPGGILINNMHESILELEKPVHRPRPKYAHVTTQQKEDSKLDKDFWLSVKNSDVWLMKPEKSGRNRDHAAPFPEELPVRLIRAYSFVGETVLDPFLGSGTTLVAAARHGRNGIGYDISPDFCAMAERRLKGILL